MASLGSSIRSAARATFSAYRSVPIRWRLAGGSAALTFVILAGFAAIVGTVPVGLLRRDGEDQLEATQARGPGRAAIWAPAVIDRPHDREGPADPDPRGARRYRARAPRRIGDSPARDAPDRAADRRRARDRAHSRPEPADPAHRGRGRGGRARATRSPGCSPRSTPPVPTPRRRCAASASSLPTPRTSCAHR
jgi:hypothetical protein